MSDKTKIVVIRMKELLYTLIFTALIVVMIIVLVYMFLPKTDEDTATAEPDQTISVTEEALIE